LAELSGVRRLQPVTDRSSERSFQIKGEVILTDEQAALCRAVLCQELMKISNLIATGKDGTGQGLTSGAIKELLFFGSRLQLTLLALGMTSGELADIVASF
jgi:hypothetical protein